MGPGLLEGRLALVTGAASGIGRAIAIAYAQAGARVIVTDLVESACAATLDQVLAVGTSGWSAPHWPREYGAQHWGR